MKNHSVILTFILVILLLLSSSLSVQSKKESTESTSKGDHLVKTYFFEPPTIETITIKDKIYSKVSINELPVINDPGNPLLPIKGSYLLLPPNKKIETISITTSKEEVFSLDQPILPAPNPVLLNQDPSTQLPAPNPEIYNHQYMYPSSVFSKVGVYYLRGYPLLVLQLYPIIYHPTENKFIYYSNLTISISFKSEENKQNTFRNSELDRDYVKKKIDNPLLIEEWNSITIDNPDTTSLSQDNYDLLILTVEELKEGFLKLKNFHESRGLKTQIHTLKEIKPLNPKSVTADEIRSYIRDQYELNNIEYVLLGGDHDILPSKILYVQGLDEERWPLETVMPADFFYGCLDGEFNFDNDDKPGEPRDGSNGEDVDLFAEVFVGRAPVDNIEDVTRFVNKTITYISLQANLPSMDTFLMAGEYLGDYGVASWGGNYLDLLLDESNVDEYVTQGIPTERYDIIKLYDRDIPDRWSSAMLLDQINNNVHIINHDGHSNYGYNMRLVNDNVYYMENSNPFFVYSVGCMAGGFDNPEGYDCFAEYVTVKADHGAFATIMNARYGFFWSYSTDGDGTRYNREFWDAVFGEHTPIIGRAHQDSREDNVFLIDRSCMRWTYYGLNLFGDPTVCLHLGQPPSNPMLSGPSKIKTGETAVFEARSSDSDSQKVYYLFDWDDGSTSNWLGPFNESEECTASHFWSEQATYTVRVKAKDKTGLESEWSSQVIETPLNKLFQNSLFLKMIFEVIRQVVN